MLQVSLVRIPRYSRSATDKLTRSERGMKNKKGRKKKI